MTSPKGELTVDESTTLASLLPQIKERIEENKKIRRNLPGNGRLRIDRQLPFLFLYRLQGNNLDKAFVSLIATQAAYLFIDDDFANLADFNSLIKTIVE